MNYYDGYFNQNVTEKVEQLLNISKDKYKFIDGIRLNYEDNFWSIVRVFEGEILLYNTTNSSEKIITVEEFITQLRIGKFVLDNHTTESFTLLNIIYDIDRLINEYEILKGKTQKIYFRGIEVVANFSLDSVLVATFNKKNYPYITNVDICTEEDYYIPVHVLILNLIKLNKNKTELGGNFKQWKRKK